MRYIDVVIVACWVLLPLAASSGVIAPPVPEPGTLSLIAIGAAAAAVTGYAKRRKK